MCKERNIRSFFPPLLSLTSISHSFSSVDLHGVPPNLQRHKQNQNDALWNVQNCFWLALKNTVYSRDLQRHLSTWWVSCIIHLLLCFCCSCWHILFECIRKMQTAMQSHGSLLWQSLRDSVSAIFSFKWTVGSCMVMAGATVKPLTVPIPWGWVWSYRSAD